MKRRDYLTLLILLLMALLILLTWRGALKAQGAVLPPSHRLAPPVACTSANRMDIFIDEDDIMWACECEMLMTGNICRWQVIGGVDSVAARRFLRQHPRSRMYFQRHGYTIPPIIVKIP